MIDKIFLTYFLSLSHICDEKGRNNLSTVQNKGLIIIPHSQRLLDTHFSSTNDCGGIRLNVVSTGSTTGLMTSNQLEKKRERERHQKVISIKLFNSTGY